MDTPLNPQSNKIRLCEESYAKLKARDEDVNNNVYQQIPRHSKAVIVAAGACIRGVGKLIFSVVDNELKGLRKGAGL